jgi:hypothetical protein
MFKRELDHKKNPTWRGFKSGAGGCDFEPFFGGFITIDKSYLEFLIVGLYLTLFF